MTSQMSTVEEVFNIILDLDDPEFIVGDIREKAPWLIASNISAACFRLWREGVLIRGDRLAEAPGKPWIWTRVSEPPTPRFHRAMPEHKRSRREGICPEGDPEPKELLQAERITLIYDRLLETIGEIEALVEDLKLENLPNADITREYHRRKKEQA